MEELVVEKPGRKRARKHLCLTTERREQLDTSMSGGAEEVE